MSLCEAAVRINAGPFENPVQLWTSFISFAFGHLWRSQSAQVESVYCCYWGTHGAVSLTDECSDRRLVVEADDTDEVFH